MEMPDEIYLFKDRLSVGEPKARSMARLFFKAYIIPISMPLDGIVFTA